MHCVPMVKLLLAPFVCNSLSWRFFSRRFFCGPLKFCFRLIEQPQLVSIDRSLDDPKRWWRAKRRSSRSSFTCCLRSTFSCSRDKQRCCRTSICSREAAVFSMVNTSVRRSEIPCRERLFQRFISDFHPCPITQITLRDTTLGCAFFWTRDNPSSSQFN